jgi:hypothetical protein
MAITPQTLRNADIEELREEAARWREIDKRSDFANWSLHDVIDALHRVADAEEFAEALAKRGV